MCALGERRRAGGGMGRGMEWDGERSGIWKVRAARDTKCKSRESDIED